MTEMREIATALKARLSGIVLSENPDSITAPTHTVPVFFGNPNPAIYQSRPVPCIIIELDDVEEDIEQLEGGRDYEEADANNGQYRTVFTEDAEPTILCYMIRGYAATTTMWDQLLVAIQRKMKYRSALATPEPCWLFRKGYRQSRVGKDETEYCGMWRYDVHAFITYPESIEPRFVTETVRIVIGDMDGNNTTTIIVESD